MSTISEAVVATLVVGVCLFAFRKFLPQLSTGIIGLGVALAMTAIIYTAVRCCLRRGFTPILELLDIAGQLTNRIEPNAELK